MDRVTFGKMLFDDPCAVHYKIRDNKMITSLMAWVKKMAIQCGICLSLFPRKEWEVGKWRMVAKMLYFDVAPVTHSGATFSYPTQGLWECVAHFRSAQIANRRIGKGRLQFQEVFVDGAIVRKDKIPVSELPALCKLAQEYNKKMESRYRHKHPILSMKTWMEELFGVELSEMI